MAKREYNQAYYLKNKEKLLGDVKTYQAKNIVKVKEYWKRHTEKTRQKRKELRAEIFAKYGGACKHCGYTDPRALQIDHVAGNGWKDGHRMGKLSYLREVLANESGKYQILCANCNWIKRHEKEEMPYAFAQVFKEDIN